MLIALLWRMTEECCAAPSAGVAVVLVYCDALRQPICALALSECSISNGSSAQMGKPRRPSTPKTETPADRMITSVQATIDIRTLRNL
jgi:hypothetical protein